MLFSASIIVIGTLFVYVFALEDENMSRREQTMVRCQLSFHFSWLRMKSFIMIMKEVMLIAFLFSLQTFTCFVFLDLVSAVQNRGLGCGLLQNKMLVSTVSVSALTQLALVYVPFMQAVFQTAALKSSDLSVILALLCTSFGLHEARRHYERTVDGKETIVTEMEELA